MHFLKLVVIFILFAFCAHSVKAYEIHMLPERIIIPSININLPVKIARLNNKVWEVHKDTASFGENTALPGQLGNTVIFSHALPNLFGKLAEIKQGNSIHVFTSDNWYEYIVTEIKVISPDSTDILNGNNKYELTLFTCAGDKYENRFVVKAELKQIDK